MFPECPLFAEFQLTLVLLTFLLFSPRILQKALLPFFPASGFEFIQPHILSTDPD